MSQAIQDHCAGRLLQACQGYEAVLQRAPHSNEARHNLGMVLIGMGRLRPGEALVETARLADPHNPVMRETARNLGETLYRHGYWEQARPWLERALGDAGASDPVLRQILARIALPDYLAPEIYDPSAGEVLLRYAPREAETYVYTIDIVGTCNLRCPSCPVGNSPHSGRGKGFMPLALFQRILQKIGRETPVAEPQVWLYNWGEPLLHPELPAFVEAVRQAGFSSHLSSNLNVENGLKALIKANPDTLKISWSGFSQASYGVTHERGDVQLLKSNLYRLRSYLDRYRVGTRVWVGHHLYRNNLAEQQQVIDLCAELGFAYHPVQAFFQPLERVRDLLDGRVDETRHPVLQQLLVDPRDYVPNIRQRRDGQYDCELRFNQTVINHDGKVALCCGVYEPRNMLGVDFIDTPAECLEAMKYRHPFCTECRARGMDYSVTGLPEDVQARSG